MDNLFRQDENSMPSVSEQIDFALYKARLEAFLEMFVISKSPYSVQLGWDCSICGSYNQNKEYCMQCNCQKPHN